MKKWIMVLLLVFISGCVYTTDPTGRTAVSIDPNTAATIDKIANVAETGVAIGGGVSVIWPPITLICGIIGGLVAMCRNLKPKVTAAISSEAFTYNVASSIVTGIEKFKAVHPESWGMLEDKLRSVIGPEAENFIRGIRGLPEKR